MARLERDGLVEGWYQQQPGTPRDVVVTERWYRITPRGQRAWAATRAFYAQADALPGEWSHA